jgi:hypothetical protein
VGVFQTSADDRMRCMRRLLPGNHLHPKETEFLPKSQVTAPLRNAWFAVDKAGTKIGSQGLQSECEREIPEERQRLIGDETVCREDILACMSWAVFGGLFGMVNRASLESRRGLSMHVLLTECLAATLRRRSCAPTIGIPAGAHGHKTS